MRRWIETLGGSHHGFLIKPWFKNVSRSLRKESKWFLRDWAEIKNDGSRAGTFVGSDQLKAVDGWNDLGNGKFQLAYLRDKAKREVDLAVIRDGIPWFLVEAKYGHAPIGDGLKYFQNASKAPFACQVVIDTEYVDADCFARPRGPMVIPAKTFFAQIS